MASKLRKNAIFQDKKLVLESAAPRNLKKTNRKTNQFHSRKISGDFIRAETLVEHGFSLLLQNTHRICEPIAGFQMNGTAKHLDSSAHKGQ